jgi:hypothetical protein
MYNEAFLTVEDKRKQKDREKPEFKAIVRAKIKTRQRLRLD